MAGKNTEALAILPTRLSAEIAIDRLTASGFSNQDVSVLLRDSTSSLDFAAEKNAEAPEGTTASVLGDTL